MRWLSAVSAAVLILAGACSGDDLVPPDPNAAGDTEPRGPAPTRLEQAWRATDVLGEGTMTSGTCSGEMFTIVGSLA
jgi:hypothetical protein